jgi:23S rRNA pseudouridine1911/1915/1917 synthase
LTKPITHHVAEAESNRTVSAVLRRVCADRSWNQIRRLIARRQVEINGNPCVDAGRRLKAGDVVKVLSHPRRPPPTPAEVRIEFVDRQVVVVHKPSGITTVRHREERHWPARRRQFQPTLDEIVPDLLESTRTGRDRDRGRDSARRKGGGASRSRHHRPPVFPVHRIDRDTSGLVVLARTREAERHLIQQFRRHTIERRYLAVIEGHIEPQTIRSYLVRDRGDGRRGSVADDRPGSQLAVTHVRPLRQLGPLSLVECRLETGRTHQIRIHLSECGHKVCGDKLYGGGRQPPDAASYPPPPRLALHAAHLSFTHPTRGEVISLDAPLPKDLREWVAGIERQTSTSD